MLYGRTTAALPSRFLKEIPEDVVVRKGLFYGAAPERTTYPTQSQYHSRQMAQRARSFLASDPSAQNAPKLELNKGDMVNHTAFGRGMVLSVMKMGGDALLEIAFDDIGTKKLMANTASAHMKKL